jgi:hypothetical protein
MAAGRRSAETISDIWWPQSEINGEGKLSEPLFLHNQPSSQIERALHGCKINYFIYIQERGRCQRIGVVLMTNQNATFQQRFVILLIMGT